ncbi:uncharacterized protein [Pyxicephalus adspersus]|uniref:uncharacterized protein n=1 Tax=Pyxicephalus adspersus TaxID=30357 RepID=UPI003B59044B
MKSLVLSLLLFFLIGTHGAAIGQEKEAELPTPGAQECLKNVIRGAFVLGAEVAGMLESTDEEKLAHVQKRAESILIDTYGLFYAVGVTIIDSYKEVDKEIHEHYPVYRTKVLPIVEDYFSNVVKYVLSLKDGLLPIISKANTEVMKIHLKLITDIKTFFDGHKEKLQSFRDDMNAKIKPFVEQVQQEVKASEKEEPKHHQFSEEQRAIYRDILKGMVHYREDDSKKMFEYIEKFTNKS